MAEPNTTELPDVLLANLTDADDPYEDVNLEELPDWWRDAIDEFEGHDLKPFRPPVFKDGLPKFIVVSQLEAELDIDIDFRNPHPDADRWQVVIDGEPITSVVRRRHPDGYSVFETTTDEFEATIRSQYDE